MRVHVCVRHINCKTIPEAVTLHIIQMRTSIIQVNGLASMESVYMSQCHGNIKMIQSLLKFGKLIPPTV